MYCNFTFKEIYIVSIITVPALWFDIVYLIAYYISVYVCSSTLFSTSEQGTIIILSMTFISGIYNMSQNSM